MRHGASLLSFACAWVLLAACGSSSSDTSAAGDMGPLGNGGSVQLSVGGHASGASGAGHGGAGGYGGTSAAGSGGSVAAGGGAGSGLGLGGAAGGPTCPPPHVSMLATCGATAGDTCAACACATMACAGAWDACVADDGCAKAIQCLEKTCPSALCAEIAGAGAQKLVDVLACIGAPCEGACGFAPVTTGAGGGAGAGSGGKGGGAGAGMGGSGGSGGAIGGTGGSGTAGGGGAATAGAGGSAGAGGTSGVVACDAVMTTPSAGACLTVEPNGPVACNPVTGDPCAPSSCAPKYGASGAIEAFACDGQQGSAALCAPCGDSMWCAAGLVCVQGACAKLCCSKDDCGATSTCDLGATTLGVGVCRSL